MTTSSWADRCRLPLLVAAVLSLTACVSQDPLGVRVRGAQTDVVFGAPTSPPLPNFPGAARPQQPQAPSAVVEQLFPDEPFDFGFPDDEMPPLYAPAPTCPDAALNEFPDEAASDSITALPKPGRYRWKQAGKVQVTPQQSATLTGYQTRYVRRVTGVAGNQSFQLLQQDVTTGRVLATTFRVKSEPTNPVADSLDPVGLQLTRVEELDAKGNATTVLEPRPPLVYLPLPVAPGTSRTSRAVDQVSGAVLTMEATVGRRQRIDACGDIIDGFSVTSTQSFTPRSGGATSSRQYDFVVATQLGGLLISEHAKQGDALDVTFSVAQLEPDDLPGDLK